jgi:DNA-binding CsgD family transcriptional regulator
MRAFRRVQSPLLVGRDELLALTARRISEAASGRGNLVLLTGEAGIGKTRILRAALGQAVAEGFRAAKGDLAPQDQLVQLACIRDLARAMDRAEFGDLPATLLAIEGGKGNDRLASRRILVREIVEAIIDGIDRPTALAFEDLQWADELTLEVIGDLARLGRELPLFLVAAYRLDDMPLGSIHRDWRSRLLTQRFAEEVRVDRLGPSETALVTSLLLGTGLPAPRAVSDAVSARTNGIPLHIEELIAALGVEVAGDEASIRDASVPDTIEDAVLARMRRLSEDAQAVARAGAVIGRCFAPDVLAGILDRAVEDLDEPLQELVDNAIVYSFDFVDQGYFDFRHQLLRDSLYGSVPAAELRRLHARAAEFGAQLVGASEVHASLHFERAGLRDQAFEAAIAGAREAAAVSSHSESFELYRRATRNEPPGLDAGERGDLWAGYCEAAMAVDDIPAIERTAAIARECYLSASRPVAAVDALLTLATVARRDVRPRSERAALLEQAELELAAVPPSPDRSRIVATLRLLQAYFEVDLGRFDEARSLLAASRAARREASSAAQTELAELDEMQIDHLLAEVDALAGRPRDGLARMLDLSRQARSGRLEAVAVTGYRVTADSAFRLMEPDATRLGLEEGLRYADEIQQSYCRHVLASVSGLQAWAEGDWDDAIRVSELELVQRGSRRGSLGARLALAYVSFGRGDVGRARILLDATLAIARPSGEMGLVLPALWGLAETSFVGGDAGQAFQHCLEALELIGSTSERALLVPFVTTGVRAALADHQPEVAERYFAQVAPLLEGWEIGAIAISHAGGLLRLAGGATVLARGSLERAVTGWDDRGRAWEASWARLDLAAALLRSSHAVDAAGQLDAVEEGAERMGSSPLRARADELRRQSRGRATEAEAWHPLTIREFEVAKQIAAGRTNAEVAAELLVSPKTVSAHVEHILAKLEVARRAEIAAWVATVAAASSDPRTALPTR